jgi:hypothetical protein
MQRAWLIWLALTLLAWGSIALLVMHQPWLLASRPRWLLNLEFTVFPVIGWVALGAPLVAAVALFMKRWVQPALVALAVIAAAQALVAVVEFSVKPRPMPYLEIHKG